MAPEPGPEPLPARVPEDLFSSQDTLHEAGSASLTWLEPPFSLGRYVVTQQLGRGGSGAVFRAHDPELDREVAIKVVMPRSRSDRTRQRLLREAQAVAKLSHPNVVAVYDVGELPRDRDEGPAGVYMVMELVEGATLRRWLREAPRTLAEILDVLLAAGRGLAAAHRAGLVHRDFKPDNLLVGRRTHERTPPVHVLDFGLATAASGGTSTDESGPPRTTMVEIAGTPAYMAPEQHAGEPGDARTDIFAFCATAYEAVFGVQPFRGRTLEALAREKAEGCAPPPSGHGARRVPRWLFDAIAWGLQPEPARRPASLPALLERIERRRHRRRNLAIAAAAVTLAGGAIAWGTSRRPDAQACIDDGAARMDQAWGEAARTRVQDRLGALELPYAAETAARVVAVLDARTQGWRDARGVACELALQGDAAAVEHAASALACLDQQLAEIGARVELLAAADRDFARQAARTAERTALPERCLDEAFVTAQREDFGGELEADLMRARLQLELAHFVDASRAARAVADVARARGDRRREARALLLACRADARADRIHGAPASCTDAWVAGERADSGNVVVGALLQLLGETDRDDLEHATLYERLARARLESLPPEQRELGHESDLALILAQRQREAGNWLAARGHAQRAYDLMVELRGATDPAVVPAINELALVAEELGEIDRARELFEQGLAVLMAARGRMHPDVVSLENNLAGLEITLGRHEAALARLAEVLAAKRALDGPDGVWQLTTRYQQVEALVALHRADEALAIARDSIAIGERAWGRDAHELLSSLIALVWALRERGDCGEALQVLARIDAIAARSDNPDREIEANAALERGRCYAATGRGVEAGAALARAVTLHEALYGVQARPVARALLAEAAWAGHAGQDATATALLERADAILRATQGDPVLDREHAELRRELTARAAAP
ncbi:MAG: serine/threonine-protein kinase [Nannocystaceae bacterium]|nr:serine/threonine-protein kinase [Nannocystaceae bacterium]